QSTTFLMGARVEMLDPSETYRLAVRCFPWVEDPREKIVEQAYMQVACVAAKETTNLRQALGDVDFFGYPIIFEILATRWLAESELQFSAARLQGVIFLGH
ncbi:hypothetical protein PMAYCL1PPCAC_04389, partial [Pristionchus mayeri]